MFSMDGMRMLGLVAWRVFVAAVVTYVFMVVLLISTAQQKIVEGLAKQEVGYDYNVAVQYYFGPQSLDNQIAENARSLTRARARIREIQLAQVSRQAAIDQASLALVQESYRVGEAPGCLLPMIPAGALQAAEVRNLANAALSCNVDPAPARPELGPAVTRLKAAATRFHAAVEAMEASNRDLTDAQDLQAALDAGRTSFAQHAEAAARSRSIMAMLDIFKESSWPLVQPLVYVPPPLMAIVLAFASGLFGALLITLVIHVYPNTPYQFTKSSSYGARILLGGLIALGVVVLMFSGVAVLGESGAAADSQNMMAYASIGLLAGMFADQAAGALSRRGFGGAASVPTPPASPVPAAPPPPASTPPPPPPPPNPVRRN